MVVRSYLLAFLAALLASSLNGCVAAWLGLGSYYDDRTITVKTLNLFNQRQIGSNAKVAWQGDWILRRFRLGLIDAELRQSKPDIFIVQEMMEREQSPSEYDQSILNAGALFGYDWMTVPTNQYSDTGETELLGVAVGSPLKLGQFREDAGKQRTYWSIGNDGHVMLTAIEAEGQLISLFNVQMPQKSYENLLWYTFLRDVIVEHLRKNRACPKRVIVAGYLPGDPNAPRISDFLSSLALKDVSRGTCNIDSECFTATHDNQIFAAVADPSEPIAHVDRILVHEDVYIYASGIDFRSTDSNIPYAKQFGLAKLWPSKRFGWGATFRLPRCGDTDFLTQL